MSVSNHTSQPGTFEDLRGFLLDHTVHDVVVEIYAHKAMHGDPVFSARGTLWPLTLEDHKRTLRLADECAGYEGRDHTEDLAYAIGHCADFELVDNRGRRAASMTVFDDEVREVVIGRLGEISEHRGEEIVVTREYAAFDIEVMRWDVDHPDEEGTPAELPSQLISVRITRWVERPFEQAVAEIPANE
jgi:hypothetical protein